MGRRKRKKVTYRPVRTVPKIFTCPKCGHKTMKAKMKHKETRVMVECGHCGENQEVDKNDLTEPIDAFGDFIDIYYKDTEYERLLGREESLKEKEQYTELTLVYSFLEDISMINAKKFQEEFEKNNDPEDKETADRWFDAARQYETNKITLREQLASGILVDAELEDQVYEVKEDNPFDEGEAKVSEKPKRRANIEDILGDTGFLEF